MATKKTAAKGRTKSKPWVSAADAVDEQLGLYRSMRDFQITGEPSGVGEEEVFQ